MELKRCAGIAGMVALVLGVGVGSALAQQPASKSDDVQVTLGLKLWANTWETGFLNDDPTTGTNIISSTSGYKVAPIPSLSVRYKDFLGSIGYFVNTKYGFPNFSQVTNLPCCGATTITTSASSAKRKELDVNLGYFIRPQVAVTVGYKEVDQTYTNTISAPGVIFTPPTSTSTTKNRAPTIGILGFAPLGSGFTLYGNAAVGPMKAKFEDGSSAKGSYTSAELGLAHALLDTGATVSLAYKVQVIDLGISGQRARDTTNGVILGLSYTF